MPEIVRGGPKGVDLAERGARAEKDGVGEVLGDISPVSRAGEL